MDIQLEDPVAKFLSDLNSKIQADPEELTRQGASRSTATAPETTVQVCTLHVARVNYQCSDTCGFRTVYRSHSRIFQLLQGGFC